MQPRQSIIEMFSTFLQFDAERFSGWIIDPKLRRSMQRCLTQSSQSETSEKFWVFYWYKVWQTQSSSIAVAHLSAYLQEVCYWAARRMRTNFSSTQYLLTDLFQIAIVGVDKILKRFNPNQSMSLKNYASLTFSSILKDTLRQRQEVDICTDWALLHRISQKRLIQSLENVGLTNQIIAHYVLAWKCFKTIYAPNPAQASTSRKLQDPNRTSWEEIANLYNKERISQLSPPGAEVKPEDLEKWLLICAKAVRSYLYPKMVSINLPKPGQDSGELLDDMPAPMQESLLNVIIFEEEEKQKIESQAQINAVLVRALIKLDLGSQRLLQMYYGQGMTQQQIARQMEIKQYTISRRLSKLRESLLLSLAQWSKDKLHISPTSDVLQHTSGILEEWLKVHYSHPDLTLSNFGEHG